MRNLKKILSLALALVMVLSMMVTASAAFEDQDLINEKYAEAVEVMAELGILQGNGTDFNPAGTLTRAEAAVILSKVVSGKSDVKFFEDEAAYVENPFSDVPAWAVPYVLYCYQEEIVGGVGGDKYNAKGTLRGYDFAKMLLIAAGFGVHEDYVGDATKTYETKVLEAAKKAELLNGLTITLSKNITREQASQMALNAMKAGGETTITYSVVDANNVVIAKYDDILPAHQLKAALGAGYEVKPNVKSAGSLLADVWGVTYTKGGEDDYGRQADVYTFPAVGLAPAYDFFYNTPDTFKTYTNKADLVAETAALKGYTVAAKVYEDGVYTTTVDTVAALVNETGANTVVELYATKKVIDKVVIVNTYVETIEETDITKAVAATQTPEKVYVNGDKYINSYGLKAGDVVSYTKYGTTLDNVTVLEGTTAKITGLSVYGGIATYTINNGYYTMEATETAKFAELVKDSLAKGYELVYYFGANNTIVHVATVAEAETPAVVYNNFAYVLNTIVRKTGDNYVGNIWTGSTPIPTYAGAALLLGADGKTTEVAITINYTATATKVGGVSVAANSYYYVIGGKPVVLVPTDGGQLAALQNEVVAIEDGAIVFAAEDVKAGTSGNVYMVTNDTVKAGQAVIETDILVNSNTAIVVFEKNDSYGNPIYKTVKGQAAVGATGVDATAVVYSKTYNAATQTYSKVALVIFAHNDSIEVKPTETKFADYVMYTGYTSVEYDATAKALVDVHTMMKTDGTFVLVKTPHEGEGKVTLSNLVVYMLNNKGQLDGFTLTNGVIMNISDNFIQIGVWSGKDPETGKDIYVPAWFQISDKVATYGDLAVGNYVFWAWTGDVTTDAGVVADNVIDAMFIYPAE